MRKIILLTLFIISLSFFVFPKKVFAACSTDYWDDVSSCTEFCTTELDGTASGASCQLIREGVWLRQYYTCPYPCSSGGGDGGGKCVSCSSKTTCKRYDNCPGPAANQTGFCGYTKARPIVEKRWCKDTTCVNICNACTATAPNTPILSSPANGIQIRKWVSTTFSWNAVGSWGANCTDPNNSYNFCISSGVSGCDLINEDALSTETQKVWVPAAGNPNVTWSVTANNGALTSTSALGNVCVEGFNIGDPSYLSNWGAPSPTNICSRTCREDCGTDDCAGQVLTKVCNLGSWWQVKDSDIQSGGDLTSVVPSIAGTFFGTAGPGGFPGVAAYGGTTNLTGANVSSKGWLADSPVTNSRVYNYAYFTNQIPSDILSIINNVNGVDVPGSLNSESARCDTNNYCWYKYDGAMNAGQPLTIPPTNIGTRKVILLVDNANVNITGNINLTDGQGFFLMIVRGSINVNPTVGGGGTSNLEGLYFADNAFADGVGNTQLWTRGSIVTNGGMTLQRDLDADNTPPSELFEYAPDQIMLFPKIIGTRKMEWKEVAP